MSPITRSIKRVLKKVRLLWYYIKFTNDGNINGFTRKQTNVQLNKFTLANINFKQELIVMIGTFIISEIPPLASPESLPILEAKRDYGYFWLLKVT